MPLYEHVFLTRQDASAQQVEELTARPWANQVFEPVACGSARRTNRVGGTAVVRGSTRLIVPLSVELSEDILRYLTIRVDELEDGPSAMMRKADRDRERDERGYGFRDRERGGMRDRERGEHRRDRDSRPPREGGDEVAPETSEE